MAGQKKRSVTPPKEKDQIIRIDPRESDGSFSNPVYRIQPIVTKPVPPKAAPPKNTAPVKPKLPGKPGNSKAAPPVRKLPAKPTPGKVYPFKAATKKKK